MRIGGGASYLARSSDPGSQFRNHILYLGVFHLTAVTQRSDALFQTCTISGRRIDRTDTAVLNKKVFDALKPGGTYFIVDHKAEPGSGWRDAGTLHRIDPQTIIDEVTAAGFELESQSDLLANPDDPHTAAVFTMRGETDRAILKFRKPD